MKLSRIISRVFVGVVFIFSGFVKAVDPLGTFYKFNDYFQAFDISFLEPLSLFFAIALCTVEFLSGVSVMFNIKQKIGIWGVFLLMLVFTPLTLVLAITNPVSDCGCFGDAIHLTNWQTFFKNVILLIPTIFLFVNRKDVGVKMCCKAQWGILAAIAALFVLFSFYNLRHLPVIDFLPYKVGTYIPDKMIIPEGMPVDQYETTFIYEKDEKQQDFTIDNYPANDSSWTFIDSKSVLVSKGYEPPIHDLTFSSATGEDMTDAVLSSSKYTFLLISKKLEEAKEGQLEAIAKLKKSITEQGADFFLLTASSTDDINKALSGTLKDLSTTNEISYNSPIPDEMMLFNGLSGVPEEQDITANELFFQVDETTLKTMSRANPGLMLIKEGTIIDKWSWADIPDTETINNIINK